VEREPRNKKTPKDLQVKYREGEAETTVQKERKDAKINTDSLLFVYIRAESKA
jgi:hypothetical protein